jgi:phosphate butyryltransferase
MKLKSLVDSASLLKKKRIAVAQAADMDVLKAVVVATDKNMAEFTLIGDEQKLMSLLDQLGEPVSRYHLISAKGVREACQLAVNEVRKGNADAVMKGMVPTADLLKVVLNKENGLRTSRLLSHVAAFEIEGYERLVFVTDAALNIAPELKEKVGITENAVTVARALGVKLPKVAPLCPVEVVNPAMQSTLDAASLMAMNQRGQLQNCVVDGPLALDNAVSREAAEHKGIQSAVAGQADILLVPNIEVGNALYKALIYFARAKVGALIVGAKVPVILTSRADSDEAKLYSIALAAHYADFREDELEGSR